MIFKDVVSGLQSIRRTPRSSAAIVLCVALGIAAASAVTTLIFAVLYRPLPFPQAEKLVRLWMAEPEGGDAEVFLSYPEFRDIRDASTTLQSVAAVGRSRLGLIFDDSVQRMRGEAVSREYFELLGIRAVEGRLFSEDEYEVGGNPAIVLSYRAWVTQFGREEGVVGRDLRTADAYYTIIGIMPEYFRGTTDEDEIEFWIPLLHFLDSEERELRDARDVMVIGRLQDQAGLAGSTAELSALGRNLAATYPDSNQDLRLRVEQVGATWRQDFRSSGSLLAAAVALLLLVAASNVAGLMLARTLSRRRELAIHASLGATPMRVLRTLLVETSLLVVMGGVLGIVAAPFLLEALLASAPLELPDYVNVKPDALANVLGLGVVALTALAAGIIPAVIGSRTPVSVVLNRSGGKATAGGLQKKLGVALVIFDVALTMVLLVTAGMLLRSHQARNEVELGFGTQVQRLAITLGDQDVRSDEDLPVFFERLVTALESSPGVEDVGLMWPVLPPRDWNQWSIRWDGMSVDMEDRGLRVGGHSANAGFFETLDIPLLAGRMFQATDLPDSALVCVVSRTLAESLGGVEQALNREVRIGSRSFRVVGVVEDILFGGAPDEGKEPLDVYVAHTQLHRRLVSIAVKTSGDPEANLAEVQRTIQSLAPTSPVHWVSTMDGELREIYADSRFYVMLIGAFSTSALVLTAIGLFALLSNSVTRRIREFGIRMALGATPLMVTRGILLQGMAMVAVGLALGLIGTFLVSGTLQSLLYGIAPFDVTSFVIGGLVLLAVALLACYLPSRQASRVDPMGALRQE